MIKISNVYKFSIDNVEWVDSVNESLFRKLRIKAFASGDNEHTMPIKEEVLIRGAKTIYDKPILWKYDKISDDAMAHEEDEVPCGFIKECEDNPIKFERSDGKLFIVIDALIWTKYSGKLIEIFERDNRIKNVSIEIATLENGDENKPNIEEFVISGITILGEWYPPACEGCKSELLAFSKDKDEYLNNKLMEKTIKINNDKKSAVNGEWENPRRKLFVPISKSSNKTSLLKEAYLIGDFKNEDPIMSDFKYPHHVIRNGELVLHIRGVQAAFQRASQEGIVKGEIKSHLLRHYNELGLNTENFDGNVGESNMENNKNNLNEPESKKKFDDGCENKNDNHDEHDDCGEEMTLEQYKAKVEEMAKDIEKLKKDNEAYMAKITSMADYQELYNYKEMNEKEKAKAKTLSEMEKVMADIENRGINMSEDDKKKLMDKVSEFDSIEGWTNFAKAHVFDTVENVDGIVRIGLPFSQKQTSTGSIWDEI